MKLEEPEFKRCCCCIPLRYGLLFWGYVKLIASIVLLGFMVFTTILKANSIQRWTSVDSPIPISYLIWEIIELVVLMLITLLEISMNIMFIVSGHKKDPKLMKVFYCYNIVVLCLFIFAFSVSMTIDLMFEFPHVGRFVDDYPMTTYYYIRVKLGAGILYAVIQFYFVLLTRSEVRKLKNLGRFWFKNNAAEAECNMEPENGNIEPQSNEPSDKMTKVSVKEDNADVIRNNNINREKDEKLNLNKYQQIKNVEVE